MEYALLVVVCVAFIAAALIAGGAMTSLFEASTCDTDRGYYCEPTV